MIAIIAILAAILYPIFAAAKATATTTQAISNTKQTGLGILLYTNDANDCYPISHRRSGSTILAAETPAGWFKAETEVRDAVVWANSCFPYTKSYEIMIAPGLNRINLGRLPGFSGFYGDVNQTYRGIKPRDTSLSFNGLLHTLSTSEVNSPSKLTLVWWGNMKEQLGGYAFTNPILSCAADAAGYLVNCRFNSSGRPSTVTSQNDYSFPPYVASNDTAWVFNRGIVFVACDSSARLVQQNPGGRAGSGYASYKDPTATYGKDGQQISYHRCTATGTSLGAYLSFFRPDTDFTYRFGTSTTTPCTQ